MIVRCLFAACVAAAMCSASSNAGNIVVDGLGSQQYGLQSKNIKNLFTSDGFSNSKLVKLQQQLKSDDVKTDKRVTFVLTTTAGHGLSMVALVDNKKSSPSGDGNQSSLFLSTSGDGNAVQTDSGELDIDGSSANGNFTWNNSGDGDAFAWKGLGHHDSGSFTFEVNNGDPSTFPGLKELKTFQFVTWTGDEWKVVKTGSFSDDGVFTFAFTVAPIPPAAVLGLAGLSAVIAFRRRLAG